MAQNPLPSGADQPEPPRLKFLRWLVIGLTVTMIVGLITIVTLIVMTFMRTGGSASNLPAELSIPKGERPQAFTIGVDWNSVVTRDGDGQDRIHILDPDTGAILQTIKVNPVD